MKFSESWLREWVDPEVTRDALVEQLTMAGLEVEEVAPVAGVFEGVVVAEVVAVDKHPNADHLTVCTVDDGAGRSQVVCGAPNVRAGMRSAFARVGARLPGGLEIKKARLRKVESAGMLCSAAELALGDDHSGILDLDGSLPVGGDLRSTLGLDDVIVDLDLTPNRGDCLSVRGLAREVGVLNNVPVRHLEVQPVPADSNASFPVELADPAGCPRYLGRVIEGIDITAPSPFWLQEKLRRSGLRSIDPVVDVTNYVMLELGQPMHAFDLGQLSGKIVVRRARDAETLTMLDGSEVALDADTLLITDANGPVAIAGVMGGERSGVQADTRDVFLECAFFAPLAVAGTARRHGLQTDASHRYERGVDYQLQHAAMERATRLLLDIVGGRAGPVVEAVAPEALPQPPEVTLRERRLNELLGVTIAPADVDEALERLGFELLDRANETDGAGTTWRIRAPSHRFDIEREADLVEEVCRIYGYNRVPSRRPTAALALRRVPIDRAPEAELKRLIASFGYQEAVTYSFVDPKLNDLLDPGGSAVALANPMSSEQSVMRTCLLPGLVDALGRNVARQQSRARLFELGLCFRPGTPVQQNLLVGGLLWGERHPESWSRPPAGTDFFDLKGDVERIVAWSGRRAGFEPLEDPVLHPGQAARVTIDGRDAGRLGRLHPEVEVALDRGEHIFVFELDAGVVLAAGRRGHRALSAFPSVRRDLAVVVAETVTAAEVETILRTTLAEVLVDFRLFDVYRGKGIDSNEKSLGLGLTLQHPSATLTEEEISRYTQQAVAALAEGVGARLR